MPNPFHPSSGVIPPLLIGRDDLISESVEAIQDGPGSAGRATLYTGPRGAGKTVLLNAIEHGARARGWSVVAETASPGFVERITRQHLPGLLRDFDPEVVRRRLSGTSVLLGLSGSGGVTWNTLQSHVVEAGLRGRRQRRQPVSATSDRR